MYNNTDLEEMIQRRMSRDTKKFGTKEWKELRATVAEDFEDGSVDVFYYYGNTKFNSYDFIGSIKPEDIEEVFSRFRTQDQIILRFNETGELEYLDRR